MNTEKDLSDFLGWDVLQPQQTEQTKEDKSSHKKQTELLLKIQSYNIAGGSSKAGAEAVMEELRNLNGIKKREKSELEKIDFEIKICRIKGGKFLALIFALNERKNRIKEPGNEQK